MNTHLGDDEVQLEIVGVGRRSIYQPTPRSVYLLFVLLIFVEYHHGAPNVRVIRVAKVVNSSTVYHV